MSSRLKVLNRLAALYELVEQMQAISLDRAAAELREAETRVAEQAAWVETAGQHHQPCSNTVSMMSIRSGFPAARIQSW